MYLFVFFSSFRYGVYIVLTRRREKSRIIIFHFVGRIKNKEMENNNIVTSTRPVVMCVCVCVIAEEIFVRARDYFEWKKNEKGKK